jgi:hypothetical protein
MIAVEIQFAAGGDLRGGVARSRRVGGDDRIESGRAL